MAIDVPALHVGVVVPEVKRGTWLVMKCIGIDQPCALRAIARPEDLNVCAARLDGEVDWDLNARRQRKWRLV